MSKLISIALLGGAVYLAWKFLRKSSVAVSTPAFSVKVGSVPYDSADNAPLDRAVFSLAPASRAGGGGCGCR